MNHPKQDLETARQELEDSITTAKQRFEMNTGTVLMGITVQLLHTMSMGAVNKSIVIGVNAMAAYPAQDGAKQVTWRSE